MAQAPAVRQVFQTGTAFWMNRQARLDLETAKDRLAPAAFDAYARYGVRMLHAGTGDREDYLKKRACCEAA
jgi:plasmid maintenance system antidote protein VapI